MKVSSEILCVFFGLSLSLICSPVLNHVTFAISAFHCDYFQLLLFGSKHGIGVDPRNWTNIVDRQWSALSHPIPFAICLLFFWLSKVTGRGLHTLLKNTLFAPTVFCVKERWPAEVCFNTCIHSFEIIQKMGDSSAQQITFSSEWQRLHHLQNSNVVPAGNAKQRDNESNSCGLIRGYELCPDPTSFLLWTPTV